MAQPCPHDPEGILPGECYPCRRAKEALGDNKAYYVTAGWLQFKNGLKEPDHEAEIRILAEMFAIEDRRDAL